MFPMRPHLALVVLLLAGTAFAQPPKPEKKGPLDQIDGYKKHVIEGFTLLVSDETLKADVSKFKRTPLEVMELELKTVARIMPPKVLDALRKVLVWVEWDEQQRLPNGRGGNATAVYAGGHQAQMFREGKHPLKAKAVTVLRMKALTGEHQPERDSGRCVMLHELAHAVHDVVLSWDNPQLKTVYRQAMERKLYDKDQYVSTNEAEFFAELSCAYYDQLHHYPHSRDELKQHDPVTHKFMESVWGKDAKKVEAVKPKALSDANGGDEFDLSVKADKLVFGNVLLGKALTPKDAAGKVLVLGYYGGSDKAVLGRLAAIHNELSGYGVRVVAAHAFVRDPEEVKQEAEAREVPFTVLERAFVPESGSSRARSQPTAHTLVFDATGACVFRGSGHQAAPHVRAAVWNAILTKAKPPELKGLAALVAAMKSGQPFADVLAKAAAAVVSGDSTLANAARPILTELTAPGKAVLDEATAKAKADPVSAYLAAETIPPQYKGTKLAVQATDLMEKLKANAAVAAELKARALLDQMRKLDTSLMGSPGSFDPVSASFQQANAAGLGQLRAMFDQMKKKHAGTKAADAAAKLVKKYGAW